MKKYWISSLLILAVSALWIILSAPDPGDVADWRAAAPAVGFAAPEFELLAADGEPIRLSELHGKPVVLNFWASWCAPCRAEMPALQTIAGRYEDKGLVVVGVNATATDSVTKAVEFASLNGVGFPIVFDHNNAVNAEYLVRSLPTTFFITPDGTIDDIVIGGPMSEALLQTRVERLLNRNP